MSSSEGLARLKNWQSTDAVVNVLSSGTSTALFNTFPQEVPVRVARVGESELVLSVIGTGESKGFDIKNAQFLATDIGNLLVVEVQFLRGKLTIFKR
jgi:hypothetical protein